MKVFHVESNFTLQVIKNILKENTFKGFGKLVTPEFLFKARSEIPFSKNVYHIETSQVISKANHFTGSYMI